MHPAICLLPVIPVRKEPSHRSEMVSQLLFGEFVNRGEEKDDFVFVVCLFDGYEGWVQANQLTAVTEVTPTTTFVSGPEVKVSINGIEKFVSVGTPVYRPGELLQYEGTTVLYPLNNEHYWNNDTSNENVAALLEKLYTPFLYTPYLWGGKSVFGIDCSGFAQQVFKLLGVKLLRDAYLQAGQGARVGGLSAAKAGDLAFFQNENGKVTHVGIMLPENKIVHASGRVRIDTIDESGILQRESGKRTHHLHSIRRFF